MQLAEWAAVEAPLSGLFGDTGRVIRRPGWVQLITPELPLASRNEVLFARLDSEAVDRVIDETVAAYRGVPTPFKWSLPPGSEPHDLAERLQQRGFRSWQARAMACAATQAVDAPAGVSARMLDEDSLTDFLEVMARGWSVPELFLARLRDEHRRGLASGRLLGVSAMLDGVPVGTASAIISGSRAYLAGAQVLAAARGRGVYRALLHARLRALAARSVVEVVTLAREATSAPILEKLGFQTLFRYPIFQLDV